METAADHVRRMALVVGARRGAASGSGSARGLFANRLIELFAAAGKPTLDQVVRASSKRMRAARGPGGKDAVTAQRISDWRAGRNLPNTFESVRPVLLTLFALAEAEADDCPAELVDQQVWQRLWAAATAEAPKPVARAKSKKTAGDSAATARPVAVSTLRRDLATFIGRDRELERIVHAAGAGRTVSIHTIDGMAGVGKTALATRAAHELTPRFPDGQYFVELHSYTPGQRPADPADVLAGLLTGLGIDPRHLPDTLAGRRDLWRDRLARKRVLLVLDDARDHTQIEPLLPTGAGCVTLVTSRRRLVALDGALPVALDILDPAAAVDLFTALSHRSPAADRATVEQVVAHCGFLPLAIVLLAGRLAHHPSWTVADLADQFTSATDRLAELDAGHRAVRGAFDLSYHDLTPPQQRVFRRLGLHPGPDTDAYAAAALADLPVDIARREVEALYTDHLLEETRPGRYRLPDLLRDYARTLAADDPAADRDAAVDRLLDYYQHAAGSADRHIARRTRPTTTSSTTAAPDMPDIADSTRALAWMRAERANLLACLDHTATQRPTRTAELAATLAGLLERDGPWPQARALHQRAADIAERLGDRLGHANALTNLGLVHERTGHYPEAAELYHRARALYRDIDSPLGHANAGLNLSIVRWYTGKYREATELSEQALATYRDIGDRRGEANCLTNVGLVHWDTGDYRTAAALQQQALSIFQEIGDQLGAANTLTNLGGVRSDTGDYEEALHLHRQALAIYRRIGNRVGEATALGNLGFVRGGTGHHDEAADLQQQALAIYRDIGNRLQEANALTNLGHVRRDTGHYDEAADLQQQALAIFRQIGRRHGEAEVLNEIGRLSVQTGSPQAASSSFDQALEVARSIDSQRELARALEGGGRCRALLGDTPTAVARLREAVDIYRKLGAPETSAAESYLAALETGRPGE